MANKNWCKAVVDRLSIAARLYKKDFAEKGINAPISGCGIFVAVSSTHTFNFALATYSSNYTSSNCFMFTVTTVICYKLQFDLFF
jgi:hypothetical protein